MRRALSIAGLLLALSVLIHPAVRAGSYVSYVDRVNKLGITLTNYGFLGTNFTSRAPTFEYPLGSGFQHLPRAGLWVGAVRADSGFTRVTTGAQDGASGSASAGATEFSPVGDAIDYRSNQPTSIDYDSNAVSELDVISDFDDLTPKAATGSTESHQPLGIHVTQYVYGWSFGDYAHFLFVRYVIRNAGAGALTNAWVGLYSELASGNLNLSSTVPPVGWFGKKWLVYDADYRMIREHYCYNQPVPANCNLPYVPWWAGIQLLTPPDTAAGQHVTLAAWPYAPGSPARSTDVQRYAIMSAGTVVSTAADSLMPHTGDPVELLALGPFATIAAGDSITVEFALVGGAEPDSIREHAYLAQRIRDLGYPDGVVAAQSSLLAADAGADGVTLRWDARCDPGTLARVERSGDGGNWQLLAEVQPGATGEIVYADHAVQPGGRYAYRLGTHVGGTLSYTPAAWIDVPVASAFALHGARPNPAGPGEGTVSFALAQAGAVRLECFDLLGRREASLDLGTLGAGEHVVSLARVGVLRPAVHVLRLRQGAHVASARIVTIR